MSFIPEGMTRKFGRTVLVTKKNSPHIFFGLGLVGIVASTLLACRATLKLEKSIDEIKTDLDSVKAMGDDSKKANTEYARKEYYGDLGYVYWKSALRIGRLYGPSVILGSLSVAALAGSHSQLTRRNSALTVSLATLSKAFGDYRFRVQDEIGKEREIELFTGVRDEIIEVEGKKQLAKTRDPELLSSYARVFDELNPYYKKTDELNRYWLQLQQEYLNHQLRARGHVFLNEVYDQLGFDRTTEGAIVGWITGSEGDGYIDLGIHDPRNGGVYVIGFGRFFILDFNPDGVIYKLIEKE